MSGTARAVPADVVERLDGEVRGEVVTPAHPAYDEARRVWNAMFDDRRPAAVVRCADERDVVRAIACLRDAGAPVAVRGGGHHIAGFGSCDGGFVLDLGRLRTAIPIRDGSRMLVGGGATLREVDLAGDRVGRAVPLGVVSPTGVGGLTLSGGVGWLTRRHGYTCDNLVGARVVTAGGEVVEATETQDADLLWGLRGGGGNFGVVTRFEFETHPVGAVVVAEVRHVTGDAGRVEDVLRFYRDWTAEQSRDVTAWLSIECAGDDPGQLAVSVLACSLGPSEDAGRRALEPVVRERRPAVGRIAGMRLVDLQCLQDDSGAAATGLRSYMKGEMITELTDRAIAGIAAATREMPTRHSLFEIGTLGGAMADRAETDAAVGLRDARYIAGFSMMQTDDGDVEAGIAWARAGWAWLTDASAGGVYLNFAGDEGEQRVLTSLGAAGESDKHRRLVELKRRYDPANVFRVNHNIDPAGLPA